MRRVCVDSWLLLLALYSTVRVRVCVNLESCRVSFLPPAFLLYSGVVNCGCRDGNADYCAFRLRSARNSIVVVQLVWGPVQFPFRRVYAMDDASLQLRKSKRCGYKANLVRQRLPQAHEQLFIPLLMHSLIDVALGKFSGLTVITLRLFCQPFPVFPAFAQTSSRVPRPLTATLELRAVPIARYQIRNRSKPPTLRPCCAIYSHHVRLGFAVLLASQYTTFSEEKQPHLFDYR